MNKNRIKLFAIISLIIMVFLCLGSCTTKTTEKNKTVASANASPTALSTAVSATTQTTNQQKFENCVFFGNSFIETLYEYGMPENAEFFYRVGLTVQTVFKDSMAGHSKPVIDELNNGEYSQIFMFFGENELGWSYPDIFIKDYIKVVSAIKARQPNAKIYAIAVLPVSKAVSEENVEQTNNNRIRLYNKKIENMAKKLGIGFIDPGKVIADENGDLPANSAPDGIHIDEKNCEIMLNYILKNM